MAYTIVLDPGHGGSDPGAVFEGRQEKDDSLRLAMAVGEILRNNGYDVVFTRTTDVYNTPFEKATIGNENYADLFVSIHRNSAPTTNMYSGIQTLVYNDNGIKAELARNINRNLVQLGFEDKGVVERPNLVVLKRTRMPAVLIEAGFINSEYDNRVFDEQFDEVAQAIADGIMETVEQTQQVMQSSVEDSKVFQEERGIVPPDILQSRPDISQSRPEMSPNGPGMSPNGPGMSPNGSGMSPNGSGMSPNGPGMSPNGPGMSPNGPGMSPNGSDIPLNRPDIPPNRPGMPPMNPSRPPQINVGRRGYKVQVGAYRNQYLANDLAFQLVSMGYPAKVVYENDLFKVQVGNFENIDNAGMMERRLREDGFNTFVVGPRR